MQVSIIAPRGFAISFNNIPEALVHYLNNREYQTFKVNGRRLTVAEVNSLANRNIQTGAITENINLDNSYSYTIDR